MRGRALRGGDSWLGRVIGEDCICAAACGAVPGIASAASAVITIHRCSDIVAPRLAVAPPWREGLKRYELRYITIMADLTSHPLAWRPVKAPSLAALEVLAGEVFRALPKGFRELCADLVIQVDDFPSEEVLTVMQAETEFDLLGLFQGIGLPFRSESAAVQMPNMIWLYRRPILDYWAEHEETLGAIVRHVLVHEIGHHFGLSDADMEALEQAADEAKGAM